jgi:hypothetical protein
MKSKKKSKSLFKDVTLTWWQVGLLKSAAVSFGVLLAFYFGDFINQYISLFWATLILPGLYIAYIYFKQ